MRDRAAEKRLNESQQETAARRETDRLRAMSRRAVAQHQSSCARHDVHDQRRLGRLAANLTKFRQSLLFGPLATCYSCSRYTYPSGGSYVDSDNAMLQPLHGCPNSHILPEGEDSVWFWTRCKMSHLSSGGPFVCVSLLVLLLVRMTHPSSAACQDVSSFVRWTDCACMCVCVSL